MQAFWRETEYLADFITASAAAVLASLSGGAGSFELMRRCGNFGIDGGLQKSRRQCLSSSDNMVVT